MDLEKGSSLPSDNTLPFEITNPLDSSELLTFGGESNVYRTDVVTSRTRQEIGIVLKENRTELMAKSDNQNEDTQEYLDIKLMSDAKRHYEYLKSFPKFAKFLPQTTYFIAQKTKDDPPRGYSIQREIIGETLDKIGNEELYRDPRLIRELLEFIEAAIEILQATRQEKKVKPDFGASFDSSWKTIILTTLIHNPRYSNNIMISKEPDQNGQRVFFVDTGKNREEGSNKIIEQIERTLVGPIQEFHLKRWKRKLEKMLEKKQ